MFRRAYEANTLTFLFIKNKKLLSVGIFVLINSSKHYGFLTKLIRKDEIIGMNKFEEGFMAGFLMNYRGKETEKEEKWQYPSDWLPLPEVGVNEAAFLIFVMKSDGNVPSYSFGISYDEEITEPVYIDWGDGVTTNSDEGISYSSHDYTFGNGIPLTDNIEMYIIKLHAPTSGCLKYFNGCDFVNTIAFKIYCPILCPNVTNTYYKYNKFLVYASFIGDSKNFGTRKSFFDAGKSIRRVDFEIPPTILADQVFYGCNNLSDANFIDLSKITAIGKLSLTGCKNIKKMNLQNITNIPDNCQLGNYTNCIEEINTNATSIGNGNFQNCYSLKTINAPNLTSIGNHCFTNTSIKSLYLESVISIGDGSFINSDVLASIDMPSLETIGACFYNNPNLITVSVPSLQTSGSGSFHDCYTLSSIDLSSLTTITNDTIGAYCYSLSEIIAPNIDLSLTNIFPNSYMIK